MSSKRKCEEYDSKNDKKPCIYNLQLTSYIGQLHDCLYIVLGYLPFHDLVHVSETCKLLRDASILPNTWNNYFTTRNIPVCDIFINMEMRDSEHTEGSEDIITTAFFKKMDVLSDSKLCFIHLLSYVTAMTITRVFKNIVIECKIAEKYRNIQAKYLNLKSKHLTFEMLLCKSDDVLSSIYLIDTTKSYGDIHTKITRPSNFVKKMQKRNKAICDVIVGRKFEETALELKVSSLPDLILARYMTGTQTMSSALKEQKKLLTSTIMCQFIAYDDDINGPCGEVRNDCECTWCADFIRRRDTAFEHANNYIETVFKQCYDEIK